MVIVFGLRPAAQPQAFDVVIHGGTVYDGSGGPLAKDERIDDIQFYVDPRAELLIDDIVLYEAAPPGETRPFPRRVIFAGWFDTGRQCFRRGEPWSRLRLRKGGVPWTPKRPFSRLSSLSRSPARGKPAGGHAEALLLPRVRPCWW